MIMSPEQQAEIGLSPDETGIDRLIEANQRLEILSESARLLLSSDKPEKIVQIICERVMRHLDCHAFFNYLLPDGEQRMHLNAFHGVSKKITSTIEYLDFGASVCGCVARDSARIIIDDVQNTADHRTELIRSFGIKAYACHPLMYQGQTIGTLSFGTKSRTRFSEKDLDLMLSVSNMAATAMARKGAEDALRKKDDEIRQAYTDVIAAVTGGKLVLMTDEEIRQEMGPPLTDEIPVSCAAELRGARDTLSCAMQDEFQLLADVLLGHAMVPFSEALTNAVKHGGGGSFQLRSMKGAAQICVRDNGPGIDFTNIPQATLTPGFSTAGTLGLGFTIMLNESARVLLSTRPGETIVVMEMNA